MTTKHIDTSDTQRALVHHVSGADYIIEYASVWDDYRCIGSVIIAAAGPIGDRALFDSEKRAIVLFGTGPNAAAARTAIYDRIDRWDGLTDDDADWLNTEDAAGRLSYPFGAR